MVLCVSVNAQTGSLFRKSFLTACQSYVVTVHSLDSWILPTESTGMFVMRLDFRTKYDFRELTKSVTVVRNGMTRREVLTTFPPAFLPVLKLWNFAMPLVSYRASARLQYTLFVVAIK